MKKRLCAGLILLQILHLTACTGSIRQEIQQERQTSIENGEIKIGLIASLTGDVAVYGNAVKNAVDLAVTEINRSGGTLSGYKIRILTKDDQGDPTVGAAAFTDLEENNVVAVLGPVVTSVAASATSLANEYGLPMITPTATGDSITTADDYVFRTCYKDSDQGTYAAQYAKKLGYASVAVLYAQGDQYSKGLRDAFVQECKKQNIAIASEMTSATISGETTFASQLSKIISDIGTDGFLFAPYYYDAAGPMIIPEARSHGFRGIIMGPDGYDGMLPDKVTGDLSAYNKVYFTNHYSAQSANPMVTDFVQSYRKTYGHTPNALAALGYDGAYLLADALGQLIETEGKTLITAKNLKRVLDRREFTGVTGHFVLDETGTPKKSAAIISYTYDAKKKQVLAKYRETIGE